ncbi:MAG: guanylate kinase [Acidimicrobiales bacterium]
MIIVISGPGGVGKGTVVHRLVERDPTLWLSRSWTTRARRPGEPEDAYVFVDEQTFRRRVAEGGFLEHAEFLGNLYGTPVPDDLPPGHDLLLEIDVQGAEQVHRQAPDALFVLLVAPSREEQAARLMARGDSPEQVERRLAKADEEIATARRLGAVEVVNDRLEDTVEQLEALIRQARAVRSGGPGS